MRRLLSFCVLTLLTASPALAQVPVAQRQVTPIPQPTVAAPTSGGEPLAPLVTQATAPRATPAPPRAPTLGNRADFPPAPPTTNIRLELTITDTHTGTPVVKTVSMMMLTGNSGMIRTSNFGQRGRATLNVDAVAAAFEPNLVSVRMTFEYTPAELADEDRNSAAPQEVRLNESITVLLKDGESMIVSQSADPASDRQVTTELLATILR